MDRRPLGSLAACLAAFAALGILANSCAVNPVTGRSELSTVSFLQQEVNLGAKAYVPAVQQPGGFYRDKALENYVQGVRMRLAREPDQAPFHASAGRVHVLQKNYPLADSALNKAIRLDDELVEPHFLLGALRHQKGDHRGAIPELSRSMDLLPTKQAAGMLSKSYEATGDRENAKKYAEMAQ